MAAAMAYFGMQSMDERPLHNSFPTNVGSAQQWKSLEEAVSAIVERLVIVKESTASVAAQNWMCC